jgi:hypothetical protein
VLGGKTNAERSDRGITKGFEEHFRSDEYIHYLSFGGRFMVVYIEVKII